MASLEQHLSYFLQLFDRIRLAVLPHSSCPLPYQKTFLTCQKWICCCCFSCDGFASHTPTLSSPHRVSITGPPTLLEDHRNCVDTAGCGVPMRLVSGSWVADLGLWRDC